MKHTVDISEVASSKMVAGNEKKFTKIIHNGTVKQWVGMGWVSERAATEHDRDTLPIVTCDGKEAR